MPNFGISIGLLKEKKPWLGLVHFPALNEMFYCNGESAYFVQHPFSVNERKREIEFFEQEITENSIFIINDSFIKNFSLHLNIQLMNLACASMSLCWPAISRGCGTFFSANIWDFAGAWPIFEKADLALRSLKDGKELRELDIELFAKTWKLKEPYILSSERNFEIISEKIKPKEV
jgi:fructose-1,6-bisphosphatase/inositol monophosphatase family enzyme